MHGRHVHGGEQAMRVILIAVALCACSKATPPTTTSGSGSAASVATDASAGLAFAADAGPRPAPKRCAADTDCGLIEGPPPSCCSGCVPQAMHVDDVAAARKECAAKPADHAKDCDQLHCNCAKHTARCTDGACTVEETACDAVAPPPPIDAAVAGECKIDGDCELVGGTPPSCCSRCGRTAMTKAQAAQANATCSRKGGDYFQRCPHLSCTCRNETARCRAGKCSVEDKPC